MDLDDAKRQVEEQTVSLLMDMYDEIPNPLITRDEAEAEARRIAHTAVLDVIAIAQELNPNA